MMGSSTLLTYLRSSLIDGNKNLDFVYECILRICLPDHSYKNKCNVIFLTVCAIAQIKLNAVFQFILEKVQELLFVHRKANMCAT